MIMMNILYHLISFTSFVHAKFVHMRVTQLSHLVSQAY